jgi:hypothetical protein
MEQEVRTDQSLALHCMDGWMDGWMGGQFLLMCTLCGNHQCQLPMMLESLIASVTSSELQDFADAVAAVAVRFGSPIMTVRSL